MLNKNLNAFRNLFKGNKSITTYVPTPFECAALSLDTYRYSANYNNNTWNEDPTYPSLPPGWRVYLISKPAFTDGDYCGVCYIKRTSKNEVAFAIASRGTVPTNVGNIISCIQLALGKIPFHLAYATQFVGDLYDKISNDPDLPEDEDTAISLVFTGHSLGGFTADYFYLFYRGSINTWSITFDNPGSYDNILNALLERAETPEERAELINYFNLAATRSFNYVAHANAINTCNKHFGNVFVLKDLPFNYELGKYVPIPAIETSIIANTYYLNYTLDQHAIKNIYNYLKNNGQFELDSNHVSGIMKGFLDYLWIEKHAKYWNGYIQYIWDHDEYIRSQYENKAADFFEDMYDAIRIAHKYVSEHMDVENREQERLLAAITQTQIDSPKTLAETKTVSPSPSRLGIFASDKNEMEKDFVIIDHNNPAVDNQKQNQHKRCNII